MQLPDGSHRKTRKTYDEPGHVHHLTFSCVGRMPLLSRDRPRRWLIEAIEHARRRHGTSLFAFVIMPEHAHLLVRPHPQGPGVPGVLKSIKQSVSRKAADWLRRNDPVWLERLRVRRAGGSDSVRFWLPGGGFDRNIVREGALMHVVHYIHANPVRRGIVEKPLDWAWSSARFYAGDPEPLLVMDPLPV